MNRETGSGTDRKAAGLSSTFQANRYSGHILIRTDMLSSFSRWERELLSSPHTLAIWFKYVWQTNHFLLAPAWCWQQQPLSLWESHAQQEWDVTGLRPQERSQMEQKGRVFLAPSVLVHNLLQCAPKPRDGHRTKVKAALQRKTEAVCIRCLLDLKMS
jgi:hypothetical protein